MARTLIFRGRLFTSSGDPLIGAIVDIYDTDRLDPIGKALSNAWGIWFAEVAADKCYPPFYKVVRWGTATAVSERVEPVERAA